MTRLTGVAPILLVKDIVASSNYFRDCVGFEGELFNDPPSFGILNRDGIRLMLAEAPAGHEDVPHWKVVHQLWNAYFWVENIDALFAELQTSGAKIDYSLHDKPYGVREFGIQDLDEHDIAFGEVIKG